jgi:fused signal recognition particle receptor
VIFFVGVNGVGKTTTIGKLAKRYKTQGLNVMLAAGDTFRAAAVEQLQAWGQREDIPVVAQAQGSDSASVAFDAVQSAQSKGVDVLLVDTAGRLQAKSQLMDELAKIQRVVKRLDPDAPHEVVLVLDGGVGQNALSQVKLFNETVPLTGLVVTKLDGTAKAGVLFALASQSDGAEQVPICFIGVGEGVEDLREFEPEEFVAALLQSDDVT